MSDHGRFSSYEGHKERLTGNTRGAFPRRRRALDGWMLAHAPASPAQGTTMDLGISICLISVQCVAFLLLLLSSHMLFA